MLRDVGQPQLVRAISSDSCLVRPSASVTAHRSSWTGEPDFFPFLARPLPKAENQALVEQAATQCAPPWLAARGGLIGQIPVPELRVIALSVKERLGPIRFCDVGFRNGAANHRCRAGVRASKPGPTPRRDPVRGELYPERVAIWRQIRLRQIGSSTAQNLVILLKQPCPTPEFAEFLRVGLWHLSFQACLSTSQIRWHLTLHQSPGLLFCHFSIAPSSMSAKLVFATGS